MVPAVIGECEPNAVGASQKRTHVYDCLINEHCEFLLNFAANWMEILGPAASKRYVVAVEGVAAI